MFENQPKGLWALALANTGERFGYYTMLAVFLLYLQANFGFHHVHWLSCSLTSSWQGNCCRCCYGYFTYSHRFGNRSVQG